MTLEWQKKLFWKKIATFALGGVLVSLFYHWLIQFGLDDLLEEINREGCNEFARTSGQSLMASGFKMYLLAYLLFGLFPHSISQSPWYMRGMYFLLFYIFCWFIYLVI